MEAEFSDLMPKTGIEGYFVFFDKPVDLMSTHGVLNISMVYYRADYLPNPTYCAIVPGFRLPLFLNLSFFLTLSSFVLEFLVTCLLGRPLVCCLHEARG
jgi:hypothetical protein